MAERSAGDGSKVLRRRGDLIAVIALVLVVAMAPEAAAQPRGTPAAPRNAPPALPPSGHQTEPVDLNEGKSAAELFQAGCSVCHQSPAGLAKGRREGELTSFLRQHYTSGVQHAAALANFLASRGGPAVAAPPRQAPIDRPPAPIGRRTPDDDRKAQEAVRPPEREVPGKRKPPERPAAAARTAPLPAPPQAAPAAAPEPAPAADTGTSASSPPVEEKPAAPEIPL
jgi:hypothetical protein